MTVPDDIDPMTVPSSDVDLFGDEMLAEPYEAYAELRDQGPVVHLTHHDLYAVARYAEARQVLDDPITFCSGQGVGLNDLINALGQGTTLMSDGASPRPPRRAASCRCRAHR